MAIPSTGQVTYQMLQDEFGGSYPIQASEYYGVATGIPASGRIGLNDFRGAAKAATPSGPAWQTVYVGTRSANYDIYELDGYGRASKYAFFHPESAADPTTVDIGSISQYVGIVGGYDLLAITAQKLSGGNYIVIQVSNPSGTNPSWTTMKIRNGVRSGTPSGPEYSLSKSSALWGGLSTPSGSVGYNAWSAFNGGTDFTNAFNAIANAIYGNFQVVFE